MAQPGSAQRASFQRLPPDSRSAAATLTTRYRYLDSGRTTAIEVTTLVSEAAPHLAATQLRITPEYDGTVQLSFPLLLWAEHAPRFPLAQMSGPEIEEAVAAR